jgi:hypothetical protein
LALVELSIVGQRYQTMMAVQAGDSMVEVDPCPATGSAGQRFANPSGGGWTLAPGLGGDT